MTEVAVSSESRTGGRPTKLLTVAWFITNIGLVLFAWGDLAPHIDPVCSGSPWSALSWILGTFALGGLLLAVSGLVAAARQRRTGAAFLWSVALLASGSQLVLGVLAVHMATIPCLPGLSLSTHT
jgi:hypothetical protein